VLRLLFVQNDLAHASRENGRTPLCISGCVLTWLLVLNDLLHATHENGRTPLCMSWCSLRLLFVLNDLVHASHENGHTPLCMSWCALTALRREWLGTCITWKWLHSTVYELMCLKDCPSYWMSWYMHHMKMAALHCVWADVPWLLFIQNDLLHASHKNGCTPLCMSWCALTALRTEWLGTCITWKWLHSTVYELMFLNISCTREM
jgi:hypothetical protein